MSHLQRILFEAGSIASIVSVLQWVIVYMIIEDPLKTHIGRSLIGLAALTTVTPALFILSLFLNLSRFTSNILAWIEIAELFIYVPFMLRRTQIWIQTSRRGDVGELPAGKCDPRDRHSP